MWVGEFVQRRASASRCQRVRNFGFPVTGAVNCLMWFLGSKFRSSSRASSVYSQLLNHLPSPFASSFMGESIFNLLQFSLHCNTQLCPDTYLENFLSLWLQADISSASPITLVREHNRAFPYGSRNHSSSMSQTFLACFSQEHSY